MRRSSSSAGRKATRRLLATEGVAEGVAVGAGVAVAVAAVKLRGAGGLPGGPLVGVAAA